MKYFVDYFSIIKEVKEDILLKQISKIQVYLTVLQNLW